MAKSNRRSTRARRTSLPKVTRPAATAPTFGEVLEEMRAEAHQGVAAAIHGAASYQPDTKPRRIPKLAHGHRAQALFDGIVEALSEAIIAESRPGFESEMASLVADMLMSRVEQHTCAGRA